jgi:hypothetical protein
VNVYGYVGGDPVNFVDVTGEVRFDADMRRENPKLVRGLREFLRELRKNEHAIDVLSKRTGLSQDDVRRALLRGRGPLVRVGTTVPGAAADCGRDRTITLAMWVVDGYRYGKVSDRQIEMLLLHELAHSFETQARGYDNSSPNPTAPLGVDGPWDIGNQVVYETFGLEAATSIPIL